MSYRLLLLFLVLLGLTRAAPAQTWQLPNTDLGAPKPQGPRIPKPGNLLEDQ